MQLDIYVNYPGTCEDAFRFYERHLGGRVTGLVRHEEQPNPNIPVDWKHKVLHARMELGGAVLMGADIPQAEAMRSAYVSLTVDSQPRTSTRLPSARVPVKVHSDRPRSPATR